MRRCGIERRAIWREDAFVMEHSFFTDHYEALLIGAHIVLVAGVIFFMALSTTFQIGLLVASALFLIVMMHSGESNEPPCGAAIGRERIARPRPGFEMDKI